MSVLANRLAQYLPDAKLRPRVKSEGRLVRMVGLTLEAVGCDMPVGSYCSVETASGSFVEAEVVGFSGERLFLMPVGIAEGLKPSGRVIPNDKAVNIPVGPELLGRVLNGIGEPLDGKGPINSKETISLQGKVINPLDRKPIDATLDVGIKAINALFTVGQGQRIGLFAGSGVGKSMLLGMMTRFTEADIIIVGLVGERGREVKEFIDQILGHEGLARSVVVASPADDSPLMRLRAAMLTTSIAEYFRDQGKKVLMLMDSLTRFAQAQREIALAVGEPPATKGYPPSVFAKIPQLVERAGNGKEGTGGSITAFYTVLTEGDDQQDPIADATRAILDGHIVLSRRLAEEGHYPAIDPEASISRVMPHVVTPEHLKMAYQFKQLYARYQQSKDLISVGAYNKGADAEIDAAIALMPNMKRFLQQDLKESFNVVTSFQQMHMTLNTPKG
ncbi:flagellum-specific ATP synthase [Oceanospirillum multiglobuliferum]|uniref:Flagellum-specific ATP synthase n=1 Tax=Oceanospirillum multiglobuliferum TaxID=64969 RepID=A0A1T4L402_9GAMM|nr:flagellar protein export ATPase FliI [Oceanospirillum multiglobuliferum]OPX56809.1 flagellum-specific ATP synthase FliI [Oceanospirillum multiglobuliferum]SJZ49449.1 flagellum-specific ATP synthase [Oceanospirillum multiglobuliferum]